MGERDGAGWDVKILLSGPLGGEHQVRGHPSISAQPSQGEGSSPSPAALAPQAEKDKIATFPVPAARTWVQVTRLWEDRGPTSQGRPGARRQLSWPSRPAWHQGAEKAEGGSGGARGLACRSRTALSPPAVEGASVSLASGRIRKLRELSR